MLFNITSLVVGTSVYTITTMVLGQVFNLNMIAIYIGTFIALVINEVICTIRAIINDRKHTEMLENKVNQDLYDNQDLKMHVMFANINIIGILEIMVALAILFEPELYSDLEIGLSLTGKTLFGVDSLKLLATVLYFIPLVCVLISIIIGSSSKYESDPSWYSYFDE